jgi:2-dehydropantoate 2-reductase
MFRNVVAVGAGAVGSYYGGLLARAGVPVTLVARAAHAEAINKDGLFLDTTTFKETVRVKATTDMAAVRDADLVLLCVKTLDTVTAAREAKAQMNPDAVMISMQNGVDNAERIKEELGFDVISAAVYVAASVPKPGTLKHSGRGEIVMGGPFPEALLKKIADMFSGAGMPCRVSADLPLEMWSKLVMNGTYNALSALTGCTYGVLVSDPSAVNIMMILADEIVAVAKAKGIKLDLEDMKDRVRKLGPSMPGTLSSTQQDLARGKLTEIDSLNGYIAAQGKRYGVATPMNAAMHSLVRLREGRTAAA